MMRHWKLLGLDLVLVGALAAPLPARAQEQIGDEPNKDSVVLKQLGDLKTSIDALTKAIKEMQTSGVDSALKMQKANGDIEGLKRQLTQLQQEEIAGLRQQVTQMQRDLDELNRRTASPPRVATYPPPQQQPATGRVRLINSYQAPVTVVVNGRAHTLNPGAIVTTDPIPAGTFTYEVLGVQPMRDRTLAANELFTITIHP